jgi:hypothetical protein
MTDSASSILTQGAPNTQGDGQGSGGGASNSPWYGDLISKETDADFTSYVKNKNYPDALAAIKGHYNAEKMIGLDRAGRTVTLPRDDSDTEGLKAFRAKMGVPDSADGYKLPFKEGASDAMAKEAAKWFHAEGVPPKAAEKIATSWNTFIEAQMAEEDKAIQTKNTQEMNALRAELGNKFDTHAELSRRAFAKFGKDAGFTPDDMNAMQDAIGSAKTVKLFMKMGDMLREADFAGGEGTMGMPPDQIRNKIKEIQTNRTANKYTEKEWSTVYMPQVMKMQEDLDKA